MYDPRQRKLAELLVNYSVNVQPGQWVFIRSHLIAEPLVNEVLRAVLDAGGNPNVVFYSDEMDEIIYRHSSDEQLTWVSPLEKQLMSQADVLIHLRATTNSRSLSGIDPQKQQLRSKARQELMEIYMGRAAQGDLNWTLTQYPCSAYAQEADMSLSEFEDFVYQACYIDREDPVAEWKRVHKEQQKVVDWLKGKKQVTVKSPHADLSLSIEGRTFINSDGTSNMPSGEVFTGPVEDSANGWVEFTYPAIRRGREVSGIRLEFENGKVIKASAEKNEEYLHSMLDMDEGSRYLGEFAIGTNYGIQKFTKSILYDEKIGGSFHMAVGAGYPETGSKNKSGIHWDMICDIRKDSEIRVDGELLYKNGKFMI